MKELYFSLSLIEDCNEMNEMLGNLIEIYVNSFSIFGCPGLDLMAGIPQQPYFSLRQPKMKAAH